MLSTSAKLFVGVLLAMFLITSSLGVAKMNMTMGSDGQMSSDNCFMPGMATLCHMNPLEHIAAWQSMFTAVPSQNDVILLLAALLALALGALLVQRRTIAPPEAAAPQLSLLYFRQRIPIFNPLQEAFSQGILHSKAY